ncbi:hypothetical protein [Jiella marina]|uniref:hypothetical protein n=1 Tax=Jiella sp. LLJ827 TaxID=2917712 RepID=UPI0021014841|nr:hypothetical protein [Jiella sp. LLJ827]MCQ0989739.1 hypothetical protein [Jiella sp. LLJ827]
MKPKKQAAGFASWDHPLGLEDHHVPRPAAEPGGSRRAMLSADHLDVGVYQSARGIDPDGTAQTLKPLLTVGEGLHLRPEQAELCFSPS